MICTFLAALLKGEGMGMAKAAELNGYPGPTHVLTLAKELALTESQLQQVTAISRQTPSNFPCQRWIPISSKPSPFKRARLAALSGNTRLVSLCKPATVAASISAPRTALPAPRPRYLRAT
jgi:hypothetical protein